VDKQKSKFKHQEPTCMIPLTHPFKD